LFWKILLQRINSQSRQGITQAFWGWRERRNGMEIIVIGIVVAVFAFA
jgi:hypothetical protein